MVDDVMGFLDDETVTSHDEVTSQPEMTSQLDDMTSQMDDYYEDSYVGSLTYLVEEDFEDFDIFQV